MVYVPLVDNFDEGTPDDLASTSTTGFQGFGSALVANFVGLPNMSGYSIGPTTWLDEATSTVFDDSQAHSAMNSVTASPISGEVLAYPYGHISIPATPTDISQVWWMRWSEEEPPFSGICLWQMVGGEPGVDIQDTLSDVDVSDFMLPFFQLLTMSSEFDPDDPTVEDHERRFVFWGWNTVLWFSAPSDTWLRCSTFYNSTTKECRLIVTDDENVEYFDGTISVLDFIDDYEFAVNLWAVSRGEAVVEYTEDFTTDPGDYVLSDAITEIPGSPDPDYVQDFIVDAPPDLPGSMRLRQTAAASDFYYPIVNGPEFTLESAGQVTFWVKHFSENVDYGPRMVNISDSDGNTYGAVTCYGEEFSDQPYYTPVGWHQHTSYLPPGVYHLQLIDMTITTTENFVSESIFQIAGVEARASGMQVWYDDFSDPTTSIFWWDGDVIQPAELIGWKDTDSVPSAEVLGWWDGTAIQPLGT